MKPHPTTQPARAAEQPEDRFGPSDSSDTASERPPQERDLESDAAGTGARPAAEPPYLAPDADPQDVEPDKSVDADDAGLAYSPPDPARNGGDSDV